MKRTFLIYGMSITVVVFLVQACNSKPTNKAKIASEPKEAKAVSLERTTLGTLLKPTNEFVVASLPVTTPKEAIVNVPVNVYGTIEANTRAVGNISARVSGRIDKLYLRYRFQMVKAGQKVLELYSPELLTAEENLLFVMKDGGQDQGLVEAAKQKLLLLGMSSSELHKLIETGKPLYRVTVYSNYTGHVMSNGMSDKEMSEPGMLEQELPLKEGMYVSKGQTLFNIMNPNETWAALQIFPEQQSVVKKGDAVEILPETDTGAVIKGKIDFIEPFFRNNSKTLTARVYFKNTNTLTLGSQVTAKIYTNGKKGLWLPQSAVLTLGMNKVVLLKSDGGFIAHKIAAGMRTDDKVEVLSGLNATDSVATNAQYLMDSESFIKTVSN